MGTTGTPVTLSTTAVPKSLRDLRIQLVKDTGDYSLVQTSGLDDMADDGANRLINDAIARLCAELPPPDTDERLTATLAAGAYTFDVPGIRALSKVWFVNSDNETTEIYLRDYTLLRNLYLKRVSAVDVGTPRYFCRNPRLGTLPEPVDPLAQEYTVTDTPFYEWSSGAVGARVGARLGTDAAKTLWAHTGGEMVLTADAAVTEEKCLLFYRFTQYGTTGAVLRLKAELPTGITLKVTERTFTENEDGTISIAAELDVIKAAYSSESTEMLALPTVIGERVFVVSVTEFAALTEAQTITISEFDVFERSTDENYLVYPPSDTTYTLEAIGSKWTPELADDYDENWWTQYPRNGVVMKYAQAEWEDVKMANPRRAAEIRASVAPVITGMKADRRVEQNRALDLRLY